MVTYQAGVGQYTHVQRLIKKKHQTNSGARLTSVEGEAHLSVKGHVTDRCCRSHTILSPVTLPFLTPHSSPLLSFHSTITS